MNKEKSGNNQKNNSRDIRRKSEIFKSNIRGIKTVIVKHNTSKHATEVKK